MIEKLEHEYTFLKCYLKKATGGNNEPVNWVMYDEDHYTNEFKFWGPVTSGHKCDYNSVSTNTPADGIITEERDSKY